MKLVSFERNGYESWGVVVDDGIVDLGVREGGSVLQLLREGLDTDRLAAMVSGIPADLPLDSVTLLPPVVRGEKIICIGVNYANRNAEYKDNTPDPE